MARLDAWFVAAKIAACLAALPLLFARPAWARHLVAVNIAIAVLEASAHAEYLNAMAGVALVLACYLLLSPQHQTSLNENEAGTRLVAFVCLYAVWNVHFLHAFGVGPWTSVPQNVLPLIVVALALVQKEEVGDRALWLFALSRALVILVLCLHLCDPRSCHRHL